MLEVIHLSKIYQDRKKTVEAVRDISFQIGKGEIVGLLGVNGAGKTTTLRIIVTLLKPTTGSVFVNGYEVTKEPENVRKQIGFLTASTGLYARLTGRETLMYFGKLHSIPQHELNKRIDEAIQLFHLSEFIDRKCDKLSTGQKQRINLARTTIHQPDLLILDEPTAGLDVLGAKAIVQFIRNVKSRGQSVLFSTHRMEEAESLCDRVIIIHQGKILADSTIKQLRAESGIDELQDLFLHIIDERE
ncbi:MAG: ATP-binding cassette domain-containing protein [bacterium]|nr:ATP-binding cassette domain-containing protein [bacterium]